LEKLGQYLWSNAGQERILATFLELGCRTVPAEGALVALLEEGSGDLVISATYGGILAGLPVGSPLLRDQLPALAVSQGKTLRVADASRDPRGPVPIAARYGIALRDLVCVPLVVGERRLGVYVFMNKIGGTFTEEDEGLLESGGWLTGSAVCYAQLYEIEQSNRRLAQTLSSFSMAITQSLDVDVVLGVLLSYLRQLVPYDKAAALLLEWDSRFVVRAVRGRDGAAVSLPALSTCVDADGMVVLRELLQNQTGAVIEDLRKHPSLSGVPFAQESRSWMGIPLVASGQIIGLYTLASRAPRVYSARHLELAETLASQASAAVQSAWLFEKVVDGRSRLQALSRQLVKVQEDERRAVSRELHDEAGQSLASLKLGLHLLGKKLNDADASRTLLAGLEDQLDQVMVGLHRLAFNLRPASLDHVGLSGAIQQMVDTYNSRPGPRIEYVSVGSASPRFPELAETALYRIVQEAVGNALLHAHATRVSVRLDRGEGRLKVRVEDDGTGFDVLEAQCGGRLGLLGMRERAEMLGGSLVLESVPGRGTTVLAEVPDGDSGSSG